MLGRTPTLTELGIFSALWSEHCSYKHSKPVLKTFPTDGAAGASRARERTPASSACPTGGRSPSRSSRTTTPRPSSPTRARPPASAASCATSSPWARARWRCSTASASVRSTAPRNRYLFAGVVKGVGDYGNCVGVPDAGRRGRLRAGLRGQSAGQRDVRRHPARGGPDPRRGPTASATSCSPWAPDRPRRHPRRQLRLGGPLGEERGPPARRCRSATRSPRSCCSRPRSS